MSTIPGPLIRFVVDTPGLLQAIDPAMRQLKSQTQSASQQIAASWRATAAQMRADMARGVLSTKELADSQRSLATSLQGHISALRQRNQLSTKELANLKAMTLELERQKNAMKTGAAVGITKGTEHAMSQVGIQNMLGVTRTLDALVNRYFGGAAGSAFRTLRDTAYYSSLAGQESGKTSLLAKVFTPAGLATAGGVGALVAGGAAILKMSVDGGKLAVQLTNLANQTGLTTDNVIKLRSATSVLDVDFDRVVTGFRKFSQEITLASQASLPNASARAKEAAALFKTLGVNIQQAAKDPFAAIQQLSASLSRLPDGATKTAVAVELFGRGGMELLPVLDRMTPAINATAKSSADLAQALTGGAAKSMEDLKAQMVNFKNETDALEVSLAQKVIPALVTFVGWIDSIASTVQKYYPIIHMVVSPVGFAIDIAKAAKAASPSAASPINPAGFLAYASKDSAKTLNELASALATTGKKAKEAKTQIEKVFEGVDKEFFRGSYPRPGFSGTTSGRSSSSRRAYSSLGPAPDISDLLFGLPTTPTFGLPNIGQGSPAGILDQVNKVNDEYFEATASESDKIKKQYDDQLDYWKFIQTQYPAYAQQAADAITKIQQVENQKLADLQKKQLEDYKRQADSLFNDLISGNTKNFTKSIEKDVEDIITQPFRKQFENLIGGLLYGLNGTINGTSGGSTSAGAGASGSGIFGAFLSKIFGSGGLLGPGGTSGTFKGPLGIGAVPGNSRSIQQMYVTAGSVIIGGGIGSASSSGNPGGSSSSPTLTIPGIGNLIFGGASSGSSLVSLPSFSSAASLAASLGGGSSTSSGLAGLLNGNLLPLAGSLLVGGLGATHGSVTSEATGAAGAAAALAKALGFKAGVFGNPTGPGAPTNLGSQLAGTFSGAGMLVSGLMQGGLGGTLSDVSGGAEIGTMFGGLIGGAIGAAAGAIVGGIRAIFGGDSWNQRVANAMSKQAIYLPPSETFSFAQNGSIAQTMQTGFGMSGNTATTYALPSGTPFWANPIYGPLTTAQKGQLNQWEYGLNPNEPFFGAGASGNNPGNPFVGNFNGWNGRAFPTQPSVQVHVNLPAYVDAATATAALSPHAETIAQLVSSKLGQYSSGFARAASRAVNLP